MRIDLHQTGSVGVGGHHLQLIKFWRSSARRNGVCIGGKFWLCLATAIADSVHLWVDCGGRAVFVSEHFFITIVVVIAKVKVIVTLHRKLQGHFTQCCETKLHISSLVKGLESRMMLVCF